MMESAYTRRGMLALCGAVGVSVLHDLNAGSAEKPVPAAVAVDHILLGASDLDSAIAWFQQKTGIKAEVGGSHPGVGTRNALASLGGRHYLEIIAPDPKQTTYGFQIDVRKLAQPRLITWAAATANIEELAKRARESGNQLFGPRDGSRAKPDGKQLQWKSLGVTNKFGQDGVEPFPFFIQWTPESVHPSQDSPKGCELQSFQIGHPEPEALMKALRALGIEAKVTRAVKASLKTTLKTPKGKVELS